MPEFLINLHEIPGVPVGRIFVPHSFTRKSTFQRWYRSIRIQRQTVYASGIVIWFIAPVSVYRSLAFFYPHPVHAAYTHYLLNSASTFFKGLKPPHLSDIEYLD